MGRFLYRQKKLQAAWRRRTDWLTVAARDNDGHYSKKTGGPAYDFCLPLDCADENLFPDIASSAKAYFKSPPGTFGRGVTIPWHDGKGGRPSTHLCDSQVCCVNFLFPFVDNESAATTLLSAVFSESDRAIPVQPDVPGLIEFEWLGDPTVNLLDEGSPRQRGANATSMDAAMCFADRAGARHLVLIEWKYTEGYRGSEKVGLGKFDEESRGAVRRARYGSLFDGPAGPVIAGRVTLSELGYEPFYQFLRQQLLAQALEHSFSSVRVLHIAPRANRDFALVTPERLRREHPGATATQVWGGLLRRPDLFASLYTEDLFGPLVAAPPTGLERWADYIRDRYAFVLNDEK